MHFDDLHPGRVFHHGTVSLTEAEIIGFARLWDPQPFHIDPENARASRWGGIIASGWQTSGVAMRLFHQAVLAGSESIGSPGIDYIRFVEPVRPGDTLRLEATLLDRRQSQSKPDLGITRWRWCLYNQHDAEVYIAELAVLFDLAPKNGALPGPL